MDPRPKVRVQLKTRLVPILVGLLIILQLAYPYRGWLMLLIVFSGLWVLCYIWARSLSRGLTLTREIRFGWTQVGDRLEERFTLINRAFMPALWVEIRDRSNMPGYDTNRGTGIEAKGTNEWRCQNVCKHRGVFTLGPTALLSGDPFGLYTVEIDIKSTQSLLVLPPIIPLPDIEVAPGGRVGEGRPRLNALERTVSTSGIREYSPGDHMRWIHWPTSIKHNGLFVRLFDSTPASDWWIILDMDQQVQAGIGEDSTVEHAITLAASLADYGIRQGKSVGLITYGDNLKWLPPQGGDTQRWNILRTLALLGTGLVPLAELLKRIQPAIGHHSSVVVITPALNEHWIQNLILMMRLGVVPTVLLLDPSLYATNQQEGHVDSVIDLLLSLGVKAYKISPDLFDRPETHPGHLGEWNIRILPTGRVVPVGPIPDENWRTWT